ncbi:MAG: type I DNA topoisomerase [Tissierellia bacterium]|nr:type I DNA topoisomerase [Tissierellia bacterium]
MQKNLVIVESPAKAKTIRKFLGKNYKVKASVGHVRDLPKSKLGIDIENNFEPRYITIRGKGPVVQELRREAKKSDKIYLATDPDREGEAISWHLAHILGIEKNEPARVEFNEITKNAVLKAIEHPRTIDKNLVDSQQARRILDRLVGYKISPLLWRKIRRGLSAGRVQSVTVKLICDREKEIDAFKPEEYWSIKAMLEKDNIAFESEFYGVREDDKDKKVKIGSKDDVEAILASLDNNEFIIDEVKKGKRRRNPYAPYTTSTLQQDASSRLRFSTRKSMMLAQQLYEGIDIKGEGTVGLITYIRTDSTRVSEEAVGVAKAHIIENYGKAYSNGGRYYRGKDRKEAQDAHEAIRPTSVLREPEAIKDSLTSDQFKLYDLIWRRFVGSQMNPAQYDTISVNILCNDKIFRASGSQLKFDGFLRVYGNTDDRDKDIQMPNLIKGERVKVNKIQPKQHFTQPPPRYTEASLIKTLEELGIGRPSTYSPTISTILNREYVNLDNRTLVPTELGMLVDDLLGEHFKEIVNEEFTADLEERLDKIAEGEYPWQLIVGNFYKEFDTILGKAEEAIEKIVIEDEVTDVICEKCGQNMVIKHGRYGKFLACPGYPECKNTKAIVHKLGIPCPLCGGDIVKRRSKRRRIFYGCNNFPDCNFVSWNEPIEERCPDCNGLMVKKQTRKNIIKQCFNKDCGYVREEKR